MPKRITGFDSLVLTDLRGKFKWRLDDPIVVQTLGELLAGVGSVGNRNELRLVEVAGRDVATRFVTTRYQVIAEGHSTGYTISVFLEPLLKALRSQDFFQLRKHGGFLSPQLIPQDSFIFGHQLWETLNSEATITADQLRLEFLAAVDRDRVRYEKLKRKFDSAEVIAERKREPIAESVRIFVWRRDEGKCVRCGSSDNLEFDHIIAFSKGGSNTERNIQLLCERCNRSKGSTL